VIFCDLIAHNCSNVSIIEDSLHMAKYSYLNKEQNDLNFGDVDEFWCSCSDIMFRTCVL